MLTILVKTIVNTNNHSLAIKYYRYQQPIYFCDSTFLFFITSINVHFLHRHSVIKVNRKIVVEKWQNHYSYDTRGWRGWDRPTWHLTPSRGSHALNKVGEGWRERVGVVRMTKKSSLWGRRLKRSSLFLW